jgi:hypothetical protein
MGDGRWEMGRQLLSSFLLSPEMGDMRPSREATSDRAFHPGRDALPRVPWNPFVNLAPQTTFPICFL